MIGSFRNRGLQLLFTLGKDLEFKSIDAQRIIKVLDVVDLVSSPRDAAFVGVRYDEWMEGNEKRYGIMVSDHWLVSFGWSEVHAIDVDLERID